MLQFGVGYGAFAALRTAVTPFFKTIFGESARIPPADHQIANTSNVQVTAKGH
jgi:hypothetical protein